LFRLGFRVFSHTHQVLDKMLDSFYLCFEVIDLC